MLNKIFKRFSSRLNDSFILFASVVIAATLIGLISNKIIKHDDNFVEEIAERVVEEQLNLEEGTIDFTPDSTER